MHTCSDLINRNISSRGKTGSMTTGKDLFSLKLLRTFTKNVMDTCLPTIVKGELRPLTRVRLFL